MAGSSANFPAARFRDRIRFVMEMAAPPDETQRATFHFDPDDTFVGLGDDNDVPFDPDAEVSRTIPPPVTVPCAIKYHDDQGELTPFGHVTPTRVEVILLDEDYQLVKLCTSVIVGGDRYIRRREQPQVGLFNVGVHVLHFAAESEA